MQASNQTSEDPFAFLDHGQDTTPPAPATAEQKRLQGIVEGFKESCPKCGGSGVFRSYNGRSLGRCFTCKGAGHLIFKQSAEKRAGQRHCCSTNSQ